MSAHSSSPPRWSLPATQNTAPVIKFRCLYTHDMRRKAKRWQDGFLKYHTFNKRVMVYDPTGNFIGDLHSTQGDAIQDGDELELDRGVLIQVCESMEKTDTDLSALYSNKKSQNSSPARPGQSPTPSARPTATPRATISSQSSRSLNDLLGIKKTPIGRVVSPYDERHSPSTSIDGQRSLAERAAKRQKMLPRRPNQSQPVVIDLSDSDTAVQNPSVPKQASTTAQLPRNYMRRNASPSRAAEPAVRSGGNHYPGRPQGPVGNIQKPQKDTSRLPPSVLPAVSSRSAPSDNVRNLEKPRVEKPHPEKPHVERPHVEKSHVEKPSLEKSHVEKPQFEKSYIQKHIEKPHVEKPHVEKLQSALPKPQPPPAMSSDRSPAQVNPLRLRTDRPRKKLMYRALLPGQASANTMTTDRNTPAQAESYETDAKTRAPPSTNPEYTPSPSTLFVLDEMDSSTTTRGHDSPIALPHSAKLKGLAARSSSSGLRKSVSDPSALINYRGVQSRSLLSRNPLTPDLEPDPPREQGPWTSEALDLFDFWPPGRPKPN